MIGIRHGITGSGARQSRNRIDTGDFHCLVDFGGAGVERTTKQKRKTEHIVHLVGIIGTPGGDNHVGTDAFRLGRVDFGRGISERKDDRFCRHRLDHFGFQQITRRQSQEYIGVDDRLAERAQIGSYCKGLFVFIHLVGTTLEDNATRIADDDVVFIEPHRHQQLEAGERRRASARGDQPDLAKILTHYLERGFQRRRNHDRGTVLVVVEHRYRHFLA